MSQTSTPGSNSLLGRSPAFVFALAVYPVMFIAASNPGQAPLKSVMAAIGMALVGALAALAVARAVVGGSWRRAALYAAIFIVLFYAYGPLYQIFETRALDGIEDGERARFPIARIHTYLSVAALLVLSAIAAIFRLKPRYEPGNWFKAANILSIALVALSAGQVALHWGRAGVSVAASEAPSAGELSSGSVHPDIYYIILDGYARADVLAEQYHHSNEPFVSALNKLGFTVSEQSNSNYYWTFLSLASSLNFDYLENFLAAPQSPSDSDRGPAYAAIRDSAAARFLRERGYRIHHMQSTWGATRDNPAADVQFGCRQGALDDEFLRSILESSWLRIFEEAASLNLAECHNSNFELLGAKAREHGPKFVFAHFLLPHHPYLFDRDGRILRDASLSNQFELQKALWEKKGAYIDQLEYINRKVLETLTTIIQQSSVDPVILLQSDHGPNLVRGLQKPDQLRVRFANLAAFRVPGAPTNLFPADETPVNEFRRLFNHLFAADLRILPERHFVSSYGAPLRLCEVTGFQSGELATHAKSGECDFVGTKYAGGTM